MESSKIYLKQANMLQGIFNTFSSIKKFHQRCLTRVLNMPLVLHRALFDKTLSQTDFLQIDSPKTLCFHMYLCLKPNLGLNSILAFIYVNHLYITKREIMSGC